MPSATPFGSPNLASTASGVERASNAGIADSKKTGNSGSTPNASERGAATSTAQLTALQTQLVALQRRALLAETAGMLAHEYNNLMTPVLARASYAISKQDAELNAQTLERIVGQVSKALDLSRHLLRFFTPEEEPDIGCSVLEVVESSLQDTVRPLKKDGIEVIVNVPAELRAKGPAVLLEQVMLNLVLNAKAALRERRGRVHVTARAVEDCIEIEVHDSGVGIEAELRETVFSPFLANTTQEAIEAPQEIGLGLKLCRLIVTQHGGNLRVAESPDGGCCFTVRWPSDRPVSANGS